MNADLRFDPDCPPPLEGIPMGAPNASPNWASRFCGWLWARGCYWLSWKVADLYFWLKS